MRIAVELVPRDKDSFLEELLYIKEYYPLVEMINIPELARFKLHSWEAACLAAAHFTSIVPHLLALDLALDTKAPWQDALDQALVQEVLLIAGDVPVPLTPPGRIIYQTTTLEALAKLQQEFPRLRVYAGIDQYREQLGTEIAYAQKKRQAGAKGFFTQPFFDLKSLVNFLDQVPCAMQDLFVGISPVITKNSQKYWEEKNKVVFPLDFEPTLAWNKKLAYKIQVLAKEKDFNLYFMPIAIDLKEYLQGLFINP